MKHIKRILADSFGYKENEVRISDDLDDMYEITIEGYAEDDKDAGVFLNEVVSTIEQAGHEVISGYFECDYMTTDYAYYIEIRK
jgi:hypothetical protein